MTEESERQSVIRAAAAREIDAAKAAAQLGISVRQLKRLVQRLRNQDRRKSKRTHPAEEPGHGLAATVSPAWSSLDKGILAGLLLGVSAAYGSTLSPTVAGGDSGEFITTAYALGVAHPPGYPLYTLFAHAMTYLPTGSIAWRVNLLSALCDLGAVALTFALLRRWTRNPWAAFGGAGLFALSPLVWRYAVVAEIFALNNFFLALVVYLFFRYWNEPLSKWLYALAFCIGLGFTNHHTLVFAALPLVGFILARDYRALWVPRVLLCSVGAFAAGLLPYLYLPIASSRQLIISWGDLLSWGGFWRHLLRSEYGTLTLSQRESDSGAFDHLFHYLIALPTEAMWLGSVLALVGMAHSARSGLRMSRLSVGGALLATLLFYLVVFSALANLDLADPLSYEIYSRFWQMPNWMVCVFTAVGFGALADRASASAWMGRWGGERSLRWLSVAVSLALVGTQLGRNYAVADQSENRQFEQVGRLMLGPLPPHAVVFSVGDDQMNIIRYLQICEDFRTDVSAFELGLLSLSWAPALIRASLPAIVVPERLGGSQQPELGDGSLQDLLAANLARHPVYLGGQLDLAAVEDLAPDYDLLDLGFLYRVVPRGTALDVDALMAQSSGFMEWVPPQPGEFRERSWEAALHRSYWWHQSNRADQVLKRSEDPRSRFRLIQYGVDILERIEAGVADPPMEVYRRLGLAYWLMRDRNPDAREKARAAWRQFFLQNPAESPDVSEIRRLLETLD